VPTVRSANSGFTRCHTQIQKALLGFNRYVNANEESSLLLKVRRKVFLLWNLLRASEPLHC
jgi:hypothetical protein